MYSILKAILAIKLTFILLIFGIGGSYLLEHSLFIHGVESPLSEIKSWTEISEDSNITSTESVQSQIKPWIINDLQSSQDIVPTSRLHRISDLKIDIEL